MNKRVSAGSLEICGNRFSFATAEQMAEEVTSTPARNRGVRYKQRIDESRAKKKKESYIGKSVRQRQNYSPCKAKAKRSSAVAIITPGTHKNRP
jgi:hypothetical protein